MNEEVVAYVYGWSPDVIDGLDVAVLDRWAKRAAQRLKENPPHRCPWLK